MEDSGFHGYARLADRIDALLPQTQCERCGFAGCRPYAEAVAEGRAAINQCPPGGQAGIDALAQLLGRPASTLDPAFGVAAPLELVRIEEPHCIGCTLCIQACPVDAIVGAAKQMHSVIQELCTGCMLCVAPCPVDCIRPAPAPFEWNRARANAARLRFENRNRRLALESERQRERLAARSLPTPASPAKPQSGPNHAAQKRAMIEKVMMRARQRQREAHAPARAQALDPDLP